MWRIAACVCALVAITSTGCAPVVEAECHPTVAHMTPPAEALDFFASGSTSPDARTIAPMLNWYGNDAMWVILPTNGEIVGRLDDKIAPYRMKRGQVTSSARRLDGREATPTRSIGGPAYGEIGFASGGVAFPTTGCWQVSYWLDGRDELRFVLRVR